MMNIITGCLGFLIFLTVAASMAPLMKRHPFIAFFGMMLFCMWIGMDKIVAFVAITFKLGIALFILAVIACAMAYYNQNQHSNRDDDDNEDDPI